MKKLMVLMMVLGTASAAFGVPYFQIDPADYKDHYLPSEVITINIVDVNVLGISIDAIVDGGIGGTAQEPQTFHPNLNLTNAGVLNIGGHLVEYVFANTTIGGASGVIYSFDYHVPDVQQSTIITIGTFSDGDLFWEPLFDYEGGSSYEGPIYMLQGQAIHVIPEPATVALLGLGGLLLRRHKK